MTMKKVILFLISAHIVKAVDPCQTPNNQNGDCKPISDCPALYKLFEHRPLSSSNTQYLRKSQCGFVGAHPKVCCPIGSAIPPTKRPPIVKNSTKATKPVTSSLLPEDVCGYSISGDKKYRENSTELDEYSWLALVEYEQPGGGRGFYCGGALINKRYVLTAAHCVKGKNLPKTLKIVSVRLGEHNTKTDPDCFSYIFDESCAPPPIDVPVEAVIAHENYNDMSHHHDIALLRLQRNVEFSSYINAICLPTEEKSYEGEKLVVGGWGKSDVESEAKLQEGVTVKQPTACGTGVNLGESQLCVGGEKGGHSCIVDSGGPLMALASPRSSVRWEAAGVASFGSPCGMDNRPGVYTKVSKYVQWIVGKMKP